MVCRDKALTYLQMCQDSKPIGKHRDGSDCYTFGCKNSKAKQKDGTKSREANRASHGRIQSTSVNSTILNEKPIVSDLEGRVNRAKIALV